MKGKRFSEEKIIRILPEAETLDNVREVCRQHNIAEQTLYRWRRRFGGMEVSEAKRLRTLERENAALKRLVGELTLDNWMLTGRCFTCVGPSQMARPNSYRLMNSPITRSCMRSVLEKQRVRRTSRLIRVRRLMCLLSIFCVFSLPTWCFLASICRS